MLNISAHNFISVGLGCIDPQVPEGATLHRSGNEARVQCKNSNQKWILNCKADAWQGDVGECHSVGEQLTIKITIKLKIVWS